MNNNFAEKFLTEASTIAIPLSIYAIRYNIDRPEFNARSLGDIKDFIVRKIIESELDLNFLEGAGNNSNNKYITGLIDNHEVFWEWLLMQPYSIS